MTNTNTSKPHATEIRRNGGLNGWYWIVRSGNRLTYHGPYRDQTAAETYRENVDAYANRRAAIAKAEGTS